MRGIIILAGVLVSCSTIASGVEGSNEDVLKGPKGDMRLRPCIMIEQSFPYNTYAIVENNEADTFTNIKDADIRVDIPADSIGKFCASSSFYALINADGLMNTYTRLFRDDGVLISSPTRNKVKFNGQGATNNYWLVESESNPTDYLNVRGSLYKSTPDDVEDDMVVDLNVYPQTATAKVMNFCGELGDSACIPFGGATNSGYWIANDSYPTATHDDKPITVEKSQTMGFSFTASPGFAFGSDGGPSLGMDLGFSIETTESSSQQLYVMHMDKSEVRNDLGNTNTFKLSQTAINQVIDGVSYSNGRAVNAGESFGRNSWKNLPINTRDAWTDNLKASNCTPDKQKDILFMSSINFMLSDSYMSNKQAGYKNTEGVRVAMTCSEDSSGHLFRTKKTTLLN